MQKSKTISKQSLTILAQIIKDLRGNKISNQTKLKSVKLSKVRIYRKKGKFVRYLLWKAKRTSWISRKKRSRTRPFWKIKKNKIFCAFKWLKKKPWGGLRRKRLRSGFKKKILTRNFFKIFYGSLKEKKFKRYFNGAHKTSTTLSALETRLDKILCRMGIARNLKYARLLIQNGFIFIKKKKIRNCNYSVRFKDIIRIDFILWYNISYYRRKRVSALINKNFLEANLRLGNFKLVHQPTFEDFKTSSVLRPNIFDIIKN